MKRQFTVTVTTESNAPTAQKAIRAALEGAGLKVLGVKPLAGVTTGDKVPAPKKGGAK